MKMKAENGAMLSQEHRAIRSWKRQGRGFPTAFGRSASLLLVTL